MTVVHSEGGKRREAELNDENQRPGSCIAGMGWLAFSMEAGWLSKSAELLGSYYITNENHYQPWPRLYPGPSHSLFG